MPELMKYIVHNAAGYEQLVIFGCRSHSVMVRNLHLQKEQVVAAGQIKLLETGGVNCFGRSTTLGITSRFQQDTDLVNRLLGFRD